MPAVTVASICTALASAFDSVTVTVTADPSVTGFGAAESVTVVGVLCFRPSVTPVPAVQLRPEFCFP